MLRENAPTIPSFILDIGHATAILENTILTKDSLI